MKLSQQVGGIIFGKNMKIINRTPSRENYLLTLSGKSPGVLQIYD